MVAGPDPPGLDGPQNGDADVIQPPEGAEPRSQKTTVPERRESARQLLAIVLVGIFGFEVFGAMVALWLCGDIRGLKELLTLIIGPTVALVGSVTGFYFGTRESERERSISSE